MLTLIILLDIAISTMAIASNWTNKYDWRENASIILTVISRASWMAFIIISIAAIFINAGIDGQIASNEERYKSLVYQFENDIYDNDNDLGKKELYNQIQDWNEDIAKGQALQNDPLVGIFYPDIYDQFEVIELK